MFYSKARHGRAVTSGNGITRRLAASVWLTSLMLVSSSVVRGAEPSPEITDASHVVGTGGPGARIVNGIQTTWYPSVGALLYRSQGAFISWCTATLIGCNSVLTAAHCIAEDEDASKYLMFFQHGGMVKVRSIAWQKKDYKPPTTSGAQADVAVLTLAEPISGIAPHAINEKSEHAVNAPGTIVGFGRTGGASRNYGLKRFGIVNAAECGAGFAKNEMVCWDYNGSGSNTCHGDSGGPLLLSENRDGEEVISGVTSGGVNNSCLVIDHSYDTSVFRYSKWVKSTAGADLGTKACSPGVPITDNRKRYKSFNGQLTSDRPLHVFQVKAKGAQVLRVGVNVARFDESEQPAQPQLFIVKGTDRDKMKALCTGQSGAAAAFCSISSPEDDQIYSVVLEREGQQGSADFQLVVSVF